MATEPQLTWECIRYGINRWAAERGWPYGCPIPSLSNAVKNRLMVAPRAPFCEKAIWPTFAEIMGTEKPSVHACHSDSFFHIVNQWTGKDGYLIAIFVDEDGKRGFYRESSGERLVDRYRALLETGPARLGAVSAKAEIKAQWSLLSRLNETQAESYILNGMFAETSPRSHVTYMLRKGYPTLAIKKNEKEGSMHFLAALCLHPLAYYQNTFAGAMVPSDDVLAHLLMIRTDEHRYWRESGQHTMWDWRSGI